MATKTTTGKTINFTSEKGELIKFVLFNNEDFKADPSAYAMNNYKKRAKIYVREENAVTKEYNSFSFCEQLNNEMNALNSLELDAKVTVGFIANAKMSGSLVINLDAIIDDLQRSGKAMSDTIASRLFLALLNGDCCMPAIQAMIVEDNTGKKKLYIIDGTQRLSCILRFINTDTKFTGTGTKLDGMHFSQLPTEVIEAFMNRIISIRVLHSSLAQYRSGFFKTLNTTSTKMSQGELVNTKYYNHPAAKAAAGCVDSVSVQKVFLPTKITEDVRQNGKADVLFALSAYYLYTKGIERTAVNGKAGVIDEFMNLREVEKMDAEIKQLFRLLPDVCEKLTRNFGESFCKRIARDKVHGAEVDSRYSMGGLIYPAGYKPYTRKFAVCNCYTSVMTFVVFGLYDIIDKIDNEAIKEIAMNIDQIFGSDTFHYKYNSSVSTADIMNRMTYVWTNGVAPVLAKYGYAI